MDIYEWADRLIDSCPTYSTGFTQLLASRPYFVPAVVLQLYDYRLRLIQTFQQTALDIFRSALNNKEHTTLLHWLLNETPSSLGRWYHCHLDNRHFTLPVFFRTDEVSPGRIAEIQCPGSLWGELQLVFEYARKMGYANREQSPASKFIIQLTNFLENKPIVHHLLDNASAPAGMRYFIERTRPGVKYWGIDRNIRVNDCNFIRSHSFIGLCADNEFSSRLSKVGKNFAYDLPPHVLFDQKASLVLPFWTLTRESFSDEIRNLFPFTTPLLPNGIELPDGTSISIEEFTRWSRSSRSYYLKYAGSNVALNWGSKAVYRLRNMSSDSCLSLLNHCIGEYKKGQIWLLQKEETQDDEIVYSTRDNSLHTEKLRAKFSGFYGPHSCLGVLAMHRHHYKVHGQSDTIISCVLSGTNTYYKTGSNLDRMEHHD